MENTNIRKASFIEAFIPLLFLIAFLAINVSVFGDDSVYGPNQMALLFASVVACIVASRLGMTWNQMLDGIVNSITSAMPSILILLLIGSLAGTWLLSGIVPAMIYYGLDILHPSIFLVASCIICAIISIATGSSWTTIATIGVALLGIGQALGMQDGLVAGAIISGAYFGDKMSPLSDTTNLAPAMAGTDLFTHIRYMFYTTVPSISLTIIIFLVIGLSADGTPDEKEIRAVQDAIAKSLNITPWLFLVPVIVVGLIIKKVAALPALFAGTVLGGVFAIIFQPDLITQQAISQGITDSPIQGSFIVLMKTFYTKLSIITDHEGTNKLLSSKGMEGMLNTIWLIICAMAFGGIMEASQLLERITSSIIKFFAKSDGSLIASTATTCVFFNVTASDQYLAIVVPGKMYAKAFRDRGLKPENLSRTLEDSGTVTSVLIPWNTCGAAQSSILQVATGEYFFYCFFNLISPVMTMLFGFLNIKIRKLSDKEIEG